VTPPCQPRCASVEHGHRDNQRQHEHQLSGGDWQYVQTHASIMKLRALNVKRIRLPDHTVSHSTDDYWDTGPMVLHSIEFIKTR
jgi:hypothetical protein